MTARRVATEDSRWEGFWARGGGDSWLRRQAWRLRWLRRHNRLRGSNVTRLRAVLKVSGEREAQAQRDRNYLENKQP